MDALQRAKWEEVRAKGSARYVLVDGLLKHGTYFATTMTTFMYLWTHGFDLAGMGDYFMSGSTILMYIFHCLFYGLLMGWSNWSSSEKAYNE